MTIIATLSAPIVACCLPDWVYRFAMADFDFALWEIYA